MKRISTHVLFALILAGGLCFAASASAQSLSNGGSTVKVGKDGSVKINNGKDQSVTTNGKGGTDIKNGKQRVTTGAMIGTKKKKGAGKLKTHRTITCKGDQTKKFRNIHISGKGNGLVVQGDCTVVLIDSRIDVTGIAIKAGGNGDIDIKNSFIKGGKSAVHASGNSTVKASDSRFKGRIAKKGNADFIKKGGNSMK